MARCLALLLLGLALTPRPARSDEPRLDRHGDPLPLGAVCRIGTVRFRQPFASNLAFSPDGKTLYCSGEDAVVAWEAVTGKELRRFEGHRGLIFDMAVSPDGRLLATVGRDGSLRLWDAASGKPLRVLEGPGSDALEVAFSPDGRRLVVSSGGGGAVRVREVAGGAEVWRWQAAPDIAVGALAFSPDGKLLAVSFSDGLVRLWETASWKRARPLEGLRPPVAGLAFTPDGKGLLSLGDENLRLWDVATGAEVRRYPDVEPLARCLALSPDGKVVAAAAIGGLVQVWDVATGRQYCSWRADVSVLRLTFAPDGKTLATLSAHWVRLWEAVTGRRLNPPEEPEAVVRHLVFSPDGRLLAVGRFPFPEEAPESRCVVLHDTRTGRPALRLEWPKGGLSALAFDPDGKTLAVASGPAGDVRLWDLATGRLLRLLPPAGDRVDSLGFPPGGLACVSGLDLVTTDREGRRQRRQSLAGGILSADGRLLAGTEAESLGLWDVATGARLWSSPVRSPLTTPLALSADGRLIVSATPTYPGLRRTTTDPFQGPANSAHVREAASGSVRLEIAGAGGPMAAAFSPDARLLATSSRGIGVRLWDLWTGRELARIGHRGWVIGLDFSPDGRLLATGGVDSTVLLWDVVRLLPKDQETPPPDAEQLDALWRDLSEVEARPAHRAMVTLASSPRQALPFLRTRLRELRAEGERLARLIIDLDDDDFRVRERASAALAEAGGLAEPALRRALEGKPSVEVARRVRDLLEGMPPLSRDGARLRLLRTIEVLERIGTPEARQLLRTLADAGPPADEEAKTALRRLARRPITDP
jgi:WD40 repeat protein